MGWGQIVVDLIYGRKQLENRGEIGHLKPLLWPPLSFQNRVISTSAAESHILFRAMLTFSAKKSLFVQNPALKILKKSIFEISQRGVSFSSYKQAL